MLAAVAVWAALATAAGQAEGGLRSPASASAVPAARAYALVPTRRCLLRRGAKVARIKARSGRLKELADLAQRSSFDVRVSGRSIAIAFGNPSLLRELLRVPGNRYRLETRRNVLLMYLPAARRQAAVVRACLRA